MNELNKEIYNRIIGTPAITSLLADPDNVFNRQAPHITDYPLVIFKEQAGGDENKTKHRSKDLIYLIEGITASSSNDAGVIDEAIDAVFHQQPLTVVGWSNFWLVREDEVSLDEVTNEGVIYYHRGGTYRIRLAK